MQLQIILPHPPPHLSFPHFSLLLLYLAALSSPTTSQAMGACGPCDPYISAAVVLGDNDADQIDHVTFTQPQITLVGLGIISLPMVLSGVAA
jgi:hypothetical protein